MASVKKESDKNDTDDNDASAWNVVATKRHSSGTSSKQTGSKHPRNASKKPWQERQPQHSSKKKNINPNANKVTESRTTTNQTSAKIKSKPKPQTVTVGDMMPGKKRGNSSNDNKRKKSTQQQERKPTNPPGTIQGRKNPARNPNIHVDSIQDFPALGSSSTPSVPPVTNLVPDNGTSVPRKPWGAVPVKTEPANMSSVPSRSSSRTSSVAPVTNLMPDNFASTARKAWGAVPVKAEPPKTSSIPSRAPPRQKNRVTKSISSLAKAISSPPPKTVHPRNSQTVPQKILKRGEQISKLKSQTQQHQRKKSQTKQPDTIKSSKPSPVSAASFFQPRPRENVKNDGSFPVMGGNGSHTMEGEEHQLLRLMQERTVYQKKGRQRVAPRKKKFSALKKKVLQERLAQWRALHPENSPTNTGTDASDRDVSSTPSCFVCIHNFTTPEELEDDDEYEEILENLKEMGTKISPQIEVFLPRKPVVEEEDNIDRWHPSFVRFQKESDATAAIACWNDLVIGGTTLVAFGLNVPPSTSENSGTDSWSSRALEAETKRHKEGASNTIATAEESAPVTITIQKVLTEDDFDDEDCMNESLEDLKKIAMQFGKVQDLHSNPSQNGDVAVTYRATLPEAKSIAENLCRVVVGGQPLYASVCEPTNDQLLKTEHATIVVLENVLTEDDLEDSDCLQESLDDIRELCQKHGSVSNVVAKGFAVKVTYEENQETTMKAVNELDGIILGGNVVRASLIHEKDSEPEYHLDLHNLLTADDLDDSDCMEESLLDVRKLASQYGTVDSVEVVNEQDTEGAFVRIKFNGNKEAPTAALEGMNGMVIGGQIITASLFMMGGEKGPMKSISQNSGEKRKTNSSATSSSEKKARIDKEEPLYSGDKLISERFAEMKRVPKIPNKGPREYATSRASSDGRVKPLLSEMLGELMRLQRRAVEDKNAKARRRLVMGLREVARGIRAHKVKMVVMANNLDQYGVIDEKLQEIIDLAKSEGVPLFVEFTKRALGKAIGKSLKIAVVGVQNADGAHQPFKKLNAIANRM